MVPETCGSRAILGGKTSAFDGLGVATSARLWRTSPAFFESLVLDLLPAMGYEVRSSLKGKRSLESKS